MRAAIRCCPPPQAARARDAERRLLRKASAEAFDRAGCPSGARPAPTRGYRRRPSRRRNARRTLQVRKQLLDGERDGTLRSFSHDNLSQLSRLHPFLTPGIPLLHGCYRPPRRPESCFSFDEGTRAVHPSQRSDRVPCMPLTAWCPPSGAPSLPVAAACCLLHPPGGVVLVPCTVRSPLE